MIRLKNILAENMLRFGPKNLSESDKRRLQSLLTESTLKELDPNYALAQKFFAAEWAKGSDGPQFATANLIYAASPRKDPEASNYNIDIFKLTTVNFTIITFILPSYYGPLYYADSTGLTDASGGSGLSQQEDFSMAAGEKDLKNAADRINYYYSPNYPLNPDVVTTHYNGRKAKLATNIAAIKSSEKFAALGPLLNGSAKTVYDLIAAS